MTKTLGIVDKHPEFFKPFEKEELYNRLVLFCEVYSHLGVTAKNSILWELGFVWDKDDDNSEDISLLAVVGFIELDAEDQNYMINYSKKMIDIEMIKAKFAEDSFLFAN